MLFRCRHKLLFCLSHKIDKPHQLLSLGISVQATLNLRTLHFAFFISLYLTMVDKIKKKVPAISKQKRKEQTAEEFRQIEEKAAHPVRSLPIKYNAQPLISTIGKLRRCQEL